MPSMVPDFSDFPPNAICVTIMTVFTGLVSVLIVNVSLPPHIPCDRMESHGYSVYSVPRPKKSLGLLGSSSFPESVPLEW